MIDTLSQWVHPDVALVITIMTNITILACALWICVRVILNCSIKVTHALMLSITLIMASFVPIDNETVNYYNMSDNRLIFSLYCFSVLNLVLLYDYIFGDLRKKDKK